MLYDMRQAFGVLASSVGMRQQAHAWSQAEAEAGDQRPQYMHVHHELWDPTLAQLDPPAPGTCPIF